MMKTKLWVLAAVLSAATAATAQTRISFTHVRAVDGGDTLRGNDISVELKRAEGSDNALLLNAGDIAVRVQAKVSSHNVRRSSVKDSAVNLIMDISMKAGRDKDSKRVEKIFYMDQKRSTLVNQRFNFKQGITMRPITLLFNATLE